jgi:hypothetical protein
MSTPENTEKWQDLLPDNTAAKIKEQLSLDITTRHINRIIAGTTPDTYGVLDVAIKIAEKEKQRIEKLTKRLTQLQESLPSSLPNQS